MDCGSSDSDVRGALKDAIAKGDLHAVSRIVEDGFDLKPILCNGRSALHEAVTSGYLAIVEVFILAQEHIDATDMWGKTALHVAAIRGRTCIAQELVKAGASVNARDLNEYTVLDFALLNSNKHIAREMIKAGASVNNRTIDGVSALQLTVRKRFISLTEELINAGASVDVCYTEFDGRTLLHKAVGSGDLPTVDVLIRAGADVNANDKFGRTPLYFAVQSCNPYTTHALIKAGASLNKTQAWHGDTLLAMALKTRGYKLNHKLIQLLLRAGYRNPKDKAYMSREKLPLKITCDPGLLSWIREQLNTGPTLRHMCLDSIRKHIARVSGAVCTKQQVDALWLPCATKRFLLFDDINLYTN